VLYELRVENLLLIERAELRLGPGLNVLTGETGAGKTVLAHALDLLLGGKARAGIVRPGGLTDDPGTGKVEVAESLGRYGQVTRDDVAAVLAAGLQEPATERKVFEVLAGDTPIAQALAQL
jgi:predicted ATPase